MIATKNDAWPYHGHVPSRVLQELSAAQLAVCLWLSRWQQFFAHRTKKNMVIDGDRGEAVGRLGEWSERWGTPPPNVR